jgi:DNA-binding MarR family transcriptional regulator
VASSPELPETIRQWMDVFTTRSIHDMTRYVKASGLSMPLFGILMHLYYRKSSTVSFLSEYLAVSVPAASQMVDRLVQSGLVERTEEPNNRRSKHLTLTRKGRSLIEKGLATRHTWVDEAVDHLSADESKQVEQGLDILGRCLRQLQEDKQQPVNHVLENKTRE